MRRRKVLVVLDMYLIYATFLKVDVGTDNQLRVKDPFKRLTKNLLTKLCSNLFNFLQKSFTLDVLLGPEYAFETESC